MSKTSTKSNDSSIGVYNSGPSTVQSSNTSSNNSSMSISSSNKSMGNSNSSMSVSSSNKSATKSPMRQNLMKLSSPIPTPTSISKTKKSVSKSKSNKSAKVENSPSTRKKQSALKKIKKAYRKSDKSLLKKRLRTYYLKGMCSDSGVCIAFDKEMDKIKKYFDNFTNFSLVNTDEIVKIGGDSVNGSVWLLPYEKNEYKSEAIMKIPHKSKTTHQNDNVVFEYINGNFLNQLNDYFPCLVLSYGLFSTNTTSKSGFPNTLNNYNYINYGSTKKKDLIGNSCNNPTSFSILVQYFKDSVTMNDYLKNKNGVYDFEELIKCLFQIYFFLHNTRETFTHNDLHTNNVLMYEPVKGKKIHYTYTLECGETIEFTSSFMPKIIDYGRCYTLYSKPLYPLLCKVCNNCGISEGYTFFKNNHPNNLPQHMSSLYPNVSQDLRLYVGVQQQIKNKHTLKPCLFEKQFGTPAITQNDSGYGKYIGNVTDCYHELINELKKIKNRSSTDSTNCIAAIEVKYGEIMKIKYNQKNAKNPSPKK